MIAIVPQGFGMRARLARSEIPKFMIVSVRWGFLNGERSLLRPTRQVMSSTGRPTSAALRASLPSKVHIAVPSCSAKQM